MGKVIALCPHLQTGRFAELMHLKETACCTLPPPHPTNDPRPKKRLSHSSHVAADKSTFIMTSWLTTRGRRPHKPLYPYPPTTMASLSFLLSLGVLAAVIAAQNPEQCHMYYGGLVFPEGSRRSVEHGLHWSKTQSRVGVAEVKWSLNGVLIHHL